MKDAKKKLVELEKNQINLMRLLLNFVKSKEFEYFKNHIDHDCMHIEIEKLAQSDIGKKVAIALREFIACHALMSMTLQQATLKSIAHTLEEQPIHFVLDVLASNIKEEKEFIETTVLDKLKDMADTIGAAMLEEVKKNIPKMNGDIPGSETIH
ncbi:MAG: hypothetical protein ACREA5_03685 [Nitrosotalea sp.]